MITASSIRQSCWTKVVIYSALLCSAHSLFPVLILINTPTTAAADVGDQRSTEHLAFRESTCLSLNCDSSILSLRRNEKRWSTCHWSGNYGHSSKQSAESPRFAQWNLPDVDEEADHGRRSLFTCGYHWAVEWFNIESTPCPSCWSDFCESGNKWWLDLFNRWSRRRKTLSSGLTSHQWSSEGTFCRSTFSRTRCPCD